MILAGGAAAVFFSLPLTVVKLTELSSNQNPNTLGEVSEPPVPEPPPMVSPARDPIPDTSADATGRLIYNGVRKDATQAEQKVVIRSDKVIKKEPNCVGGTPDQFKCYRDYYTNLVKERGSQAAMADLRSRYQNPFIYSQCHQLTHIIGRLAADIYPSLAQAFASGDSFCWSGFYHGVMEGVSQKFKPAALAENIDKICAEIPGKDKFSFDYYNCVHGLGHGAMFILNNELFRSLELCDHLSGGWEQSSCWSGAFMENIIADEINHFSKYLKADDPLYPCSAAADKYKNTCYLMQTSRMLALVGHDFAKVFELCENVGEPYVDTCYQSLGRDASGKNVSEISKTRTACLLGRNYREQSNCVIGAVKDFISYFHSDAKARELCASFPQELQRVCFITAENYYKLF